MKNRQSGVSLIGILFVGGVLAFGGIVAAQVFPTVLEYQAISKAAIKASSGSTPPEVRNIFDKAAQIDDIKAIVGKDLDVTKDTEGKIIVSFAYNKEIPLGGPAFLLIKYAGKSK